LRFSPGPVEGHAAGALSDAVEYLTEEEGEFLLEEVARALLNPPGSGFFSSQFSKGPEDPFFFQVDPYEDEEIEFLHRRGGVPGHHWREAVCRFRRQTESANGPGGTPERKIHALVPSYRINATIAANLDFSAQVTIEIRQVTGLNWLNLWLFSEAEVDSAVWEDGTAGEYCKEKESPSFWLRWPEKAVPGSVHSVVVSYHGDLIEQDQDWLRIRSPDFWYPVLGVRQGSDFRMTSDRGRVLQHRLVPRAVHR
jgi:hypothetical protein